MSVSSAGGFDEACGFATVLARRPILDERMKLRFGLHAQKLLQRSAFCENFRQASAKQIVEQETWRTRRANASNISLLSDVEAVAGEGNGCVSVRVGKVIDATEDRLSIGISRRDDAFVLCGGQDHPFVHAQEMSELIGPLPPQWLVDLFGPCNLPWRQARLSCVLLTHVRPETLPVIDNLLVEVLPVISPGTAHWILLEAIDERLRNGRSICRHVRGKVRSRHVHDQEIYEIDRGGYRWCIDLLGDLVAVGSCRRLRGERTRPDGNCDSYGYG